LSARNEEREGGKFVGIPIRGSKTDRKRVAGLTLRGFGNTWNGGGKTQDHHTFLMTKKGGWVTFPFS